jgi:hypothetical protein
MTEDRVICRTPTPDRQPTRVETWKFDTVRRAILASLPRDGEGLPFKELPARVAAHLDAGSRARLGSVGWYTTTVKLELEVRGEVVRVPGRGAQRLVRTAGETGSEENCGLPGGDR